MTKPLFSEIFPTHPTLFYFFFTFIFVLCSLGLLLSPSFRESLLQPAFRAGVYVSAALLLLILSAFYWGGAGKIRVDYFPDRISIINRKRQRNIPLNDVTKIWMGRFRLSGGLFNWRSFLNRHIAEAFPGTTPGQENTRRRQEIQVESPVWNLDVLQFTNDPKNKRFLLLQPRSDAQPILLRTQDTQKVLSYLRSHASQATFSPSIQA